MNGEPMDDEAFETLLGDALRLQAAPVSLQRRVAAIGREEPAAGRRVLAMMSPARVAAVAGFLSLFLGFAWGWSSAPASGEDDFGIGGVFYADAGLGDY